MNLRTISLYGISMTVGMRDNRSMYTESLNIGFTVEVPVSYTHLFEIVDRLRAIREELVGMKLALDEFCLLYTSRCV